MEFGGEDHRGCDDEDPQPRFEGDRLQSEKELCGTDVHRADVDRERNRRSDEQRRGRQRVFREDRPGFGPTGPGVVVDENDLAALLYQVGSGDAYPRADVGWLERGGVVHAVAPQSR